MGFAQPVEDILAESYRTGCKYKYLYTRDGCGFNPFTPKVRYDRDIKVILILSLWMKSYSVTIQNNETSSAVLHMVLFIFNEFYKIWELS